MTDERRGRNGSGAAAEVARDFLRENAALFRLDAGRVDALTLVNDAALDDSPDLVRVRDAQAPTNPDVAHAVLFQQQFDGLESALGDLVTVGVKTDGSVVLTSMQVFVGRYEARATPPADTVADIPATDTVSFVPGTYEFIVKANGFGLQRFTQTVTAGETRTVSVPLRRNLASVHNGATATGDGVNLDGLIDDTENTNWASLESAGTASAGKGEGSRSRDAR